MDILALIAAFGGGVLGAYMGALPSFIMTGFFALVGGIGVAAGIPAAGFAVDMAFGSFLAPNIAFAGGVAAAAYARKKGVMENGADITTALYGLGEPDVLLVGGCTGIIGFIIASLISMTPLGPMTDVPGLCVVILGICTRLIFGETGLTGKYTGTEKRQWFTGGKGFMNNLVWSLGLGLTVSFIAAVLSNSYTETWEALSGIYPVVCFGFSAITLIFTQTGSAVPGSHHITLPAATAAVVGITAFGPYGAFLGVVFAVIGAMLGNWAECTLNSYCDSHIDPPGFTIFILIIIISILRGVLVG